MKKESLVLVNMKLSKISNIFNLFTLFFGFYLLTSCNLGNTYSGVSRLCVSSDGKYVLTSHYGHFLILWDIENKKKKILNKNTNLNSAYFIPNSHHFVWQHDKTNLVTVQNVNGKILKKLDPKFSVYNHVITNDLSNYIASKDNWELVQIKNNTHKIIKPDEGGGSGSALLLKLKVIEPYLLSTGDGHSYSITINAGKTLRDSNPKASRNDSLLNGVVLWNIHQGKPIMKLYGLIGKAFSDISPDKKYVVAADENIRMFAWDIASGKRSPKFENPVNPNTNCYGGQKCLQNLARDLKQKKTLPKDFKDHPWSQSTTTVAVKYVDTKGHILRFLQAINYATLYQENSPEVLEYMSLGNNPRPNTYSVFYNANTIDTAPNANILVMAANRVGGYDGYASGIIVYRFDNKTKQLIRLWAPDGPAPHWRIYNEQNNYDA